MVKYPSFSVDPGQYGMLRVGDPCESPVFREFNFVYGANGSGKSSLARAMAESARERQVIVKMFDRKYVDAVLTEVEAVNALWVVADSASELVGKRAALHKKQEQNENALRTEEAEKLVAKSNYSAMVKAVGDELRPLKRLATQGTATYSDSEVEEQLSSSESAPEDTDTDADGRSELRKVVEQSDLGSLKAFGLDGVESTLSRFVGLLENADFQSLRRADLHSWATSSVAIARSSEGDPCPFCSQQLTPAAVEHIQSVSALPSPSGEDYQFFASTLQSLKSRTLGSSLPDSASFHAPLARRATDVLDRYREKAAALADEMPELNDAVEMLATASESDAVAPWVERAQEMRTALQDLLEVSSKHEEAANDQRRRKVEAFEQYERSLLSEERDRWEELETVQKEKKVVVGLTTERIDSTKLELNTIEQNIRGLMSPEYLNTDLETYLGHAAIRFESNDAPGDQLGYRIVRRSGEPAQNLSEGERTAIALLHFLRDCGSADSANPPDLVILDDPVTSLDDSALYTAHAFIESTLKRAFGSEGPTVVVLTHRHSYFRLLVEWSTRLNKKISDSERRERRERARLLETFSILDNGEKACLVREMPKHVASCGSEYALLVSELLEFSSSGSGLEQCEWDEFVEVAIQPNLARRVLEGFLSFKYSGTKRIPMRNLLQKALEDKRADGFGTDRESRLYKLLNAASHGTGLVDAYQPIASSSEIRLVVDDVLDLIERLDPTHFAAFVNT